MPHHDTALSGVIQHVFAHRFTIDAKGNTYLADLGPKGIEAFPLKPGLHVTLEGEQRPSEIKVSLISADGRDPVLIHHKKPHHAPDARPHGPVDPVRALEAVKAAGWSSRGAPHQKPKHVEVLARRDGGPWTELHVDAAGTIYKQKSADLAKWGVAAT